MKLKNLTQNGDRLKKVLDYMEKMDFNMGIYKNSKYMFYGDYKNDNFYLHIDDNTNEETVRNTLIEIVKKWWRDFESGIELHSYMGDEYFIEIRQEKDDKNVWEFIVEAMDESVYFKFNTNFVVNL